MSVQVRVRVRVHWYRYGYNYFDNNSFGFAFSPIHHTNRLPLGDDDFPIELPVIPNPVLIKNVDNEIEFGVYAKHSFD